jgi:hypothetical protein
LVIIGTMTKKYSALSIKLIHRKHVHQCWMIHISDKPDSHLGQGTAVNNIHDNYTSDNRQLHNILLKAKD